MTLDLPAGWIALTAPADAGIRAGLERELAVEVGEGHVLRGRRCRAVARCSGCDDVLFEVEGARRRWAMVHLTWRGDVERDPAWPATVEYGSESEAVEDAGVHVRTTHAP